MSKLTSNSDLFRSRGWTLALRTQVRAIERQLSEPGPNIKGHSKAAEKRRSAEDARRRELRAELERLIPPPRIPTSDNGIHEYVETKEYVLFRNHGDSWWRGVLKTTGGGFSFVQEGSRVQKIALSRLQRALVASKTQKVAA